MFINITIAFFLIFVGHQTRNLEKINMKLLHKIDQKHQEININQIEFALHNDNKYLKKLYSIYKSDLDKSDLNKKNSSNIFKLNDFLNFEHSSFIKVGFK